MAAAFESPDTLQSALAFLREYAADTGAHAACAVVRRRDIAFPQARRVLSACLVLVYGRARVCRCAQPLMCAACLSERSSVLHSAAQTEHGAMRPATPV